MLKIIFYLKKKDFHMLTIRYLYYKIVEDTLYLLKRKFMMQISEFSLFNKKGNLLIIFISSKFNRFFTLASLPEE